MMTSSPPRGDIGAAFGSRRGHVTNLSISDPNHHVTETIGTLYGDGDDDDSLPLSAYTSSISRRLPDVFHQSDYRTSYDPPSLSDLPPTAADDAPRRLPTQRFQSDRDRIVSMSIPPTPTPTPVPTPVPTPDLTPALAAATVHNALGLKPVPHPIRTTPAPPHPGTPAAASTPASTPSPLSPALSLRDVQAQSQYLTNIDNPNDIAQELSNLQALRRLSMDVGNNGDPDIPPFSGLVAMPALAPTGDDDEYDPSRLLWVPARVHPELAPSEFKSFLEKRVQSIRRRSGELAAARDHLPPTATNHLAGRSASSQELQRKKSMLSRQINNTSFDGPDHKRNSSSGSSSSSTALDSGLNLDQLTRAVQKLAHDAQQHNAGMNGQPDDKPILRVGPGKGLRRSTNTIYRKGGSLRSGDQLPPMPKRAGLGNTTPSATTTTDSSSTTPPSLSTQPRQSDSSTKDEPFFTLGRIQSKPIHDHNSRSTRLAKKRQGRFGLNPVNFSLDFDGTQQRQSLAEPSTPPPTPSISDDRPDPFKPPVPSTPPDKVTPPTNTANSNSVASGPGSPPRLYAFNDGGPKPHTIPQIVEPIPPQDVAADVFRWDLTERAVPHRSSSAPLMVNGQSRPKSPHASVSRERPATSVEEPPARSSRRPQGLPLLVPPAQPAPQAPLQAAPQAAPQAALHVAPQVVPQPAPKAAPQPAAQTQTLNDLTVNTPLLPGGGMSRTDSLTFIPTLTAAEEKKVETKKGKRDHDDDPSSSNAPKTSSAWRWLKGGSGGEKKDEETKKSKAYKNAAAVQENGRLEPVQPIDHVVAKGRENSALDRESVDQKLAEERKKESGRKSEGKKERDGSIFSSLFGSGKRKADKDASVANGNGGGAGVGLGGAGGSGSAGGGKKSPHLKVEDALMRPLRPDSDYHWTRFPLLEERAIYRMAHLKLANPRRPLLSQVLLSNFMYSYLAIVQAMHPHIHVPTSPQQRRLEEDQRRKTVEQQQQQVLQQQQQEMQIQQMQIQQLQMQMRMQMQMQAQPQLQTPTDRPGYGYQQTPSQDSYGDEVNENNGGSGDYGDDPQIFQSDSGDTQDDLNDHSSYGYSGVEAGRYGGSLSGKERYLDFGPQDHDGSHGRGGRW